MLTVALKAAPDPDLNDTEPLTALPLGTNLRTVLPAPALQLMPLTVTDDV